MEFLIFLGIVGLFGLGIITWCAYDDYKDWKTTRFLKQ